MDVDEAKVAKLATGEVTFHEPGLGELVVEHADRLHFTTSMDELLANARLLFCCVDTPPTYSGDADLSRVRAVVERLPGDGGHALVMKSTVPSGTGESIRRDMPGLSYVSCPEFLKEGSAVDDFLNPDRVVVGADPGDEWAADAVAGLYEPLGGEIVRTDVASAEMIKLASNAFLATKISFINEIANVCEEVGADVTEVARGMGLDERIGSAFLKAGIGYGGSLFPKGRLRPQAARRQLRVPLPAPQLGHRGQRAAEAPGDREADQAPRLAGRQADRPARPRVQAEHRRHARGLQPRPLGPPAGRGRRPSSPTTRSRPGRPPGCWPRPSSPRTPRQALAGADGAILVTEWAEFADLDWPALAPTMRTPLLVDGRNFLDPATLRDAGFIYEGIGR